MAERPLEEQGQIVAMVDAVVQHEAAARNRQTCLEAIFRSLLHHLMAGKMRLNEFELPAMKEGSP